MVATSVEEYYWKIYNILSVDFSVTNMMNLSKMWKTLQSGEANNIQNEYIQILVEASNVASN